MIFFPKMAPICCQRYATRVFKREKLASNSLQWAQLFVHRILPEISGQRNTKANSSLEKPIIQVAKPTCKACRTPDNVTCDLISLLRHYDTTQTLETLSRNASVAVNIAQSRIELCFEQKRFEGKTLRDMFVRGHATIQAIFRAICVATKCKFARKFAYSHYEETDLNTKVTKTKT